jgi:soluble lytic murein transglycosylase-like protein
MAGQGKSWGLLGVLVAVAVIGWSTQHSSHQQAGSAAARPSSRSASAPASASAAASPSTPSTAEGQYDPADFAAPVERYAGQAGIDPQLLMAILYNESYKPHDPSFERAWQKLNPGAAFGIANMHQATFDEVKQGRSFAGSSWEQLPDDPDLAIESAAWYLHDLATDLPAHWPGDYTKDELLALGYNTGPSNMMAFARGVQMGAQAQTYLDTLRQNWAKSGKAVGVA